ncbi:hypothetical protein FAGAP_4723 [Fusarium agapanthi]|uniref:Delta(24)-sterol reductase n=1 Tax=Fusarium agapanthi TaxID=1803897 RepID=A0A9P5E7J6_9HYPO|nr:hypothetical protein FAGAP_4723 [Fusarium agapanthi]
MARIAEGLPMAGSTTTITTQRKKKPIEAKALTTEVQMLAGADVWGRAAFGRSWLRSLVGASPLFLAPMASISIFITLAEYEGSLSLFADAVAEHGFWTICAQYGPHLTTKGIAAVICWVGIQAVLYCLLPGEQHQGQLTPAGYLLSYKINGLSAWIVTHLLYAVLSWLGILDPGFIPRNWSSLIGAMNLAGFVISALALVKAYVMPTHPEDRKFSGSFLYDFFMGIELNPRLGENFDLKLFSNGRAGMMVWTLIDFSNMAYQYQNQGFVEPSLILVTALQTIYVVDFFVNESWYLRTIDVKFDHYGFYLSWGCFCFLPTTYTIQGQYLGRYPSSAPTPYLAFFFTLGVAGYILFRSVNHQKEIVRRTGGKCTIWDIADKIRDFYKLRQPCRVSHGSSSSTRPRHGSGTNVIDISMLSQVIAVDPAHRTCLVEPNVPMDRLVDATMPYGLIPPVVMEFPGITAGGGFAGTSGKSSSFRHGFFNETIDFVEIILGMEMVDSVTSAISTTKQCCEGVDIDYVDDILYSKDHGVIITGELTNTKPSGSPVRTFSNAGDHWFYLHVKEQTESFPPSATVTEYIPLGEYLFRYDRAAFWVGRQGYTYFKIVPFNRFFRWLLDDYSQTRTLYHALHASRISDQFVVQDLALPFDTTEAFVDWVDAELGIWPLWLCPLKGCQTPTFHPITKGSSDTRAGNNISQPMLNIGVWGWGPSDREEFKAKNQALEKKLMELGGRKWLYAHTYYTEEQFWDLYDRSWYERLREHYFATTLPTVYNKVKISDSDADGRNEKGWGLGNLWNKWPIGGICGMILAFYSGDINLHRRAKWRCLYSIPSYVIYKYFLINWAAEMLPDFNADMQINILAGGGVHEDGVSVNKALQAARQNLNLNLISNHPHRQELVLKQIRILVKMVERSFQYLPMLNFTDSPFKQFTIPQDWRAWEVAWLYRLPAIITHDAVPARLIENGCIIDDVTNCHKACGSEQHMFSNPESLWNCLTLATVAMMSTNRGPDSISNETLEKVDRKFSTGPLDEFWRLGALLSYVKCALQSCSDSKFGGCPPELWTFQCQMITPENIKDMGRIMRPGRVETKPLNLPSSILQHLPHSITFYATMASSNPERTYARWPLRDVPRTSETDVLPIGPEADGIQTVFDDDSRRLVDPADIQPGGKYHSIVKLQILFEGQDANDTRHAQATGWLIMPHLIITAAHCVYDHTHDFGKAVQVRAFVGYNGKNSIDKPGVQFRRGLMVVVPKDWIISDTNRASDVAFIKVEEFSNVVRISQQPTVGQSGSPILISGESKAVGVASYGTGTRNTATVFRGGFGTYLSAMSGVMYALDRDPPGSENIRYITIDGRPEGSAREETVSDGKAFWVIFKKVASVGQTIDHSVLRTGSPFLGQVGSPIAAVAGTALGVMSKLGADASIDIDSVHVNYRQCAARAVVAEAAMRTVLKMDLHKANDFRIFDKMEDQFPETKDVVPRVAKLITSGIVESALRVSINAQAAGEDMSRLYPKLPLKNGSLSGEAKLFVDAFARYTNQGNTNEMSEFLGSIVETALSTGPPNINGIIRAIGESELSVTDMSNHVEILCHRAMIGDTCLQALIAIPLDQWMQNGLFDHFVSTVGKIGRTVIEVAPVVIQDILNNLKHDE